MTRLFSIKPAITMKGRTFKGLRGWAGKPSHPPLTDIPVTCYLLAGVFDVISFFRGGSNGELSVAGYDFFTSATHVLVVGALVSAPTILTGFWDWLRSTPKHTQAWRTANWHMAVMLTATAIVVINILIRVTGDDTSSSLLVTALSVVAAGLVTYGAAYGGSLVYDYGFNVETSGDHPVWHENERDVFPGEH